MKITLIAILICLISGCNLFQKTTENKTENLTEHRTAADQSSIAIDSSKRSSVEKWKLTVPGINTPGVEPFQPTALPDLSGMTADQKRLFTELSVKYDKLRQAMSNQQATMSGWSLEWEKTINEALNKMNLDQKADSSSFKTSDKSGQTVKNPVAFPWVLLAGIGMAGGLSGGVLRSLSIKIYKLLFSK